MARYGRAAQESVARAMRKRKRGSLQSGSGQKVLTKEQAVAIGLAEARDKGAKVPDRRGRAAPARKQRKS